MKPFEPHRPNANFKVLLHRCSYVLSDRGPIICKSPAPWSVTGLTIWDNICPEHDMHLCNKHFALVYEREMNFPVDDPTESEVIFHASPRIS